MPRGRTYSNVLAGQMPYNQAFHRQTASAGPMGLTSFLSDLFEHGRVATDSADVSADDWQRALRLLCEFERHDRSRWPEEPPEFSWQVGLWSANLLYRACHFVVQRDASPETLESTLCTKPPERPVAVTHYSADLMLRFLPGVFKLARGAAGDDPLVHILISLGRQWPLSSVGMSEVRNVDASDLVQHPCLLQMYVDRIIRASDVSRLNHPDVRQSVQAALGLYPELAPQIAAELERQSHEEPVS